jgi:hypothetical protein
MLEGPCLNHAYPIKHTYKDSGLMKKLLAGSSKKGEQKKPDPKQDDTKGEGSAFSHETGCLMIFGRLKSYASKHRQKLEHREVYEVEPAMPIFLKWSRSPITFDRSDHPRASHDRVGTHSWLTLSSTQSALPRC